MSKLTDRIAAIGAHAWARFLARINAIILVACSGLVALNQTNPEFVDKLTAAMTPTQQALVGFLFCCLVQFALARINTKAGQ